MKFWILPTLCMVLAVGLQADTIIGLPVGNYNNLLTLTQGPFQPVLIWSVPAPVNTAPVYETHSAPPPASISNDSPPTDSEAEDPGVSADLPRVPAPFTGSDDPPGDPAVVPEPSTALYVLGSALLLVTLRKRRLV
jgi:hypothetical protein